MIYYFDVIKPNNLFYKGGLVMMTTKYAQGSVYYLPDRFSANQSWVSHNYLILGKSPCKMGFVQAMSITSMRNKEVSMEVPIILCNNLISYVVSENVQSFLDKDIELSQYRGSIVDTDVISKKDFLQLLRDIYLDGLGLGIISHDQVKERYEEYCEKFFAIHKDVKEFRNNDNIKDIQSKFTKSSDELADGVSTESFNQIIIPDDVRKQVTTIESDRIKKLHTHARNWTDKEILQFLSVMDSNKRNMQFKLEFTEFQKPRQVSDKTYEVRCEAKRRELIKK